MQKSYNDYKFALKKVSILPYISCFIFKEYTFFY